MSGMIDTVGVRSGNIGDRSRTGTNYFIASFSSDAGWGTLSSGAVVPFNSIITDGDSCCLNTGGTIRFTAPVTGMYMFGAQVYTGNADVGNGFVTWINGSMPSWGTTTHFAGYFGGGTDDKILNYTVVHSLTAADYATVVASDASDYYSGQASWWGCRLS